MIMEVRALTKNISHAPQKMREIMRQIQGLKAVDALRLLEHSPRKAARYAAVTLRSAVANAENNSSLAKESMRIKEAVAGAATTIKRFTPKARGSAGPILKRRCHISIVLTDE